MSTYIRDIYLKYERSDSLTDREMRDLLNAYDAAVSATESFRHYTLVTRDALIERMNLSGYLEARQQQRKRAK